MASDDVIPLNPNPKKRKTMRDTGEILRSRELYRYYQPPPSDSPAKNVITSEDPSLTAYAQLTAIKLNKHRAMISLLDHDTQWIVGESTKTIAPYDNSMCIPGDELWLGGADVTLESVTGLCIGTVEMQPPKLSRSNTAKSEELGTLVKSTLNQNQLAELATDLPLNEIEDLSKHPKFSEYPFVTGPPNLRHYCGAPLRTRKGYYIGSLCIVDPKPGKLSSQDRDFLRWMAGTIMQHLEMVSERKVLQRVERMQSSLSVFVDTSTFERKRTYRKGSEIRKRRSKRSTDSPLNGSRQNTNAESMTNGGSKPMAPHPKEHPGGNRRLTAEQRPSLIDRNSSMSSNASSLLAKTSTYSQTTIGSSASTPTISVNPPELDPQSPESAFQSIFYRASKLIRDALDVDGVVIVDAGDGYLDDSDESQSLRSLSKVAQENLMSEEIAREGGQVSYFRQMGILGLDVRQDPTLDAEGDLIRTGPLGNKFLDELFDTFPSGKIFSYDSEGTISSGEDEEALTTLSPQPSETNSSVDDDGFNLRKQPEYVRKNLSAFLPSSTSCIFVPLYEYANIPYGSCFVWTRRSKRVFVKEEMSYMRTFARLIMSEVVRLDTVSADRAKGAFISNISHELRSPLHGILASAELLDDTKLDTFQTSLLTSVESCGRTLLDTLNHVLDFSKLNRLQSDRRGAQSTPMSPSDSNNSMVTSVDLAAITEEVVEGVFAGYDFRGINSHIVLDGASTTDIIPLQPDASGNMTGDVTSRKLSAKGSNPKREVEVIIDIQPQTDWHFSTQVGGFRRVIMNLVGNALKYTDKGYVRVKLDAEPYIDEEPDPMLPPGDAKTKVVLTVTDSGRGISREFLKTKLFVPFSQENAMSSGSGLGMSIVRQILDILGGTINVKSELGVGTEVTVTLLLSKAPKDISHVIPEETKDDGQETITRARTAATGKSIAFLGFSEATPSLRLMRNSLVKCAKEWYGMNIVPENTGPSLMDFMGKADVLLAHESSPLLSQLGIKGQKPPMIILCSNAARVDMANLTLADKGGVLDFASKPCGPKKFAKALLFCLTKTHTSRRSSQSSYTSRSYGNRSWGQSSRPPVDREKSYGSVTYLGDDGPAGAVRISPPVRSGSSSSEPVVYLAGVGTIAPAAGSSAVPMSSSPSRRKSIPYLEDFQAMRIKAQSDTQASMQSISSLMHKDSKNPLSSVPLPQHFFPGMHNVVDGALIGEGVEIDRPPFASPVIEKDNPLRPKSWAQWQSLNASAGSEGEETSPKSAPAMPEDVVEELRVLSGTPSILLVDDNPITMMLMTTFMEKKGFMYSQAQNGLVALETFRRRPGGYDIILMDLQLPVMSGLDAVRAIRDIERTENRTRRSLIIALTGSSNEAEALTAGCDKFFTKPIKLADLSKTITDYQSTHLVHLSQA